MWASLALTTAQLKTVMLLVESGGLATCELARRLNMAQSGVTPLVDKLVTLKLVRRVRDTRDQRLVWVRPTVKAAEMQGTLLQTGRPVLQKVWRSVPCAQRAAIERSVHELAAAAEQVLAAQR